MSYTITLTGDSSELSSSIFPEINLDDGYEYSCGLLDFTTYQSIPNITKANNIIEQPRNIIYLRVVPKRINFISLSVVDQNGYLIDFREEQITCRIHIKRNDK